MWVIVIIGVPRDLGFEWWHGIVFVHGRRLGLPHLSTEDFIVPQPFAIRKARSSRARSLKGGYHYSSPPQVAHKAPPVSEHPRELQASKKHLTPIVISPTRLDSFRPRIPTILPCSTARLYPSLRSFPLVHTWYCSCTPPFLSTPPTLSDSFSG